VFGKFEVSQVLLNCCSFDRDRRLIEVGWFGSNQVQLYVSVVIVVENRC
jgi:hypothetical protein